MAGKGDKLRKGANLNLYWQNYDNIFKKENKGSLEKKLKVINASRREVSTNSIEFSSDKEWAWISIGEPEKEFEHINNEFLDKCPQFKIKFWDIHREYSHIFNEFGPTKEEAASIVDFILQHKEKNFVVNCAAGVSRSGAVAYFLHTHFGHEYVTPYKDRMAPNMY